MNALQFEIVLNCSADFKSLNEFIIFNMYPNADILEFLFATVAAIVATLTGLIGAFSTFRLQNIDTELNFLKGLVINKKFGDNSCINDYIKGKQYHLLEKIYDLKMDGVILLEKIIKENSLDSQCDELLIDTDNIKRQQLLHDNMKRLTVGGFTNSLLFVFVSLLLLIITNALLQTGPWLWLILTIFMSWFLYALTRFILR